MKKQSLALTLTLCMGLGAFTACTPSQMSANPTGVNQTAVQPGQTSGLSLQAALANYHEVDASFSDTQRLARSGQFQTKLLGDLLGDDDDGDSSGSGSLNLGLGANVDASGSSSSSGSNGSSSGSGSLGVGVGANVDAQGSSSSSNGSGSGSGSLGVGVGANVDAQGSSSNSGSGSSGASGSGSLGVGVGANVDAQGSSSNSGSGSSSSSSSGSLGVGVGANVDAQGSSNNSGTGSNGSTNGSANSSLDLNLDANAMFDLVENSSSTYRDRFQNSGYLRSNNNGGFDIDGDRLEADLKAKLNVDAQLEGSRDNNDDSSRVWTQIGADALARLSSRNYDNRSWSSDRQTMADGSVNSNFYTMFRNSSTERNVTMTDLKSDTNTAFKLEERGSNFTRSAQRRSERQLDGTIHTMTNVTTNFTSGDRLEIFEDRYSNAQGSGSGTGTFRMTRADGSQQSGDLRTMLTADGSLTSYLDSDNEDFMLREDAQGRGSLSLRGTDGWDGSWTNVDFNTMLNSMTQISSRR